MMIDLDRAREIADEFIASLNQDVKFMAALNQDVNGKMKLAVKHDKVITLEEGWMFNFNSLEYVQNKDIESGLIGGTFPFIVSKEDGSLHCPGDKGKLSIFLKNEMNRKWF